jgi:hypothetical protein
MNQILVSEDALDSVKSMAQKLQEERDMLLLELREVYDWALVEKCALRPQEIESIRRVIAKVESE